MTNKNKKTVERFRRRYPDLVMGHSGTYGAPMSKDVELFLQEELDKAREEGRREAEREIEAMGKRLTKEVLSRLMKKK